MTTTIIKRYQVDIPFRYDHPALATPEGAIFKDTTFYLVADNGDFEEATEDNYNYYLSN